MALQTDPVCGMQIDEKSTAGKSDFEGRTYFFCSPGCKTRFDQNPRQFARGATAGTEDRGEAR